MNETVQSGPASRLLTQELETILQQAETLQPTLNMIQDNLHAPGFSDLLAQMLAARGLTPQQLSSLAMLSRSFTYQLCSGLRAPSRDIILRLAVVLELTLEETQRLLRAAQRGALYPRIRRDAVMIYCLSHRLHLYDTDELLTSCGELALL